MGNVGKPVLLEVFRLGKPGFSSLLNFCSNEEGPDLVHYVNRGNYRDKFHQFYGTCPVLGKVRCGKYSLDWGVLKKIADLVVFYDIID
jgi:hypothetical protein